MKNKKRVMLLNPPGDRMYLRDYYCSTVSKAGYYWHPADLLVQSGILGRDCELGFIDAIAEKIPRGESLKRISHFRPDAVLFLSGTQSWREDFSFLEQVKAATSAALIGSGEIFLENGRELVASHPFLDGAILDFISPDLRHYLREDCDSISRMIFRRDGELTVRDNPDAGKEFEIPIPAHGLFLSRNYKLPFVRHPLFATVMTDYGCPFHCSFCNSGSFGFRTRKIENIMPELEYLHSLGCGHVFVKDMSFGADREHAAGFCRALSGRKSRFEWNCYSRPDLIDEELVLLMKESGCRLIQFGLETSGRNIGRNAGAGIDFDRIREAFSLCQKHKILTGAHLILGLPGESPAAEEKTRSLVKQIKPDYLSLNVFSPRVGSGLAREKAPDRKNPVRLRNRYYRNFYLRPRYLLGNLARIRNLSELSRLVSLGFNLLKNSFLSSSVS